MKKLIIFNIILILFQTCKNEKGTEIYTLEASQDSIYIKLSRNELNHNICNHYFTQNDTSYLAVLNRHRNSINFYNLNKGKMIKETIVKKEGVNAFPAFVSFMAKSLDCIILISHFPGQIGIINGEGEILKIIKIDQDVNGKYLRPALPYFGQKGIMTDSILYLLQACNTFGEYKGIFSPEMHNQSDIAISINIKNGVVKSIPLKYPKELINSDIYNIENLWQIGYNEVFVFGTSFLKYFFITKDFSNFNKVEIESNYVFELPKNLSKFGSDFNGYSNYITSKDNFLALFYDIYNECYYFLVQKRQIEKSKEKSLKTNFIYPNCMIVIFDKKFKNLGEVHFPDNKYSFRDLFMSSKGLYISEDHVNNPTYSEDVMRFRLFNLRKL